MTENTNILIEADYNIERGLGRNGYHQISVDGVNGYFETGAGRRDDVVVYLDDADDPDHVVILSVNRSRFYCGIEVYLVGQNNTTPESIFFQFDWEIEQNVGDIREMDDDEIAEILFSRYLDLFC